MQRIKKLLKFERTRCNSRRLLVLLHVVRVAESLGTIVTLGKYKTYWYSDLLFSDWAEDI